MSMTSVIKTRKDTVVVGLGLGIQTRENVSRQPGLHKPRPPLCPIKSQEKRGIYDSIPCNSVAKYLLVMVQKGDLTFNITQIEYSKFEYVQHRVYSPNGRAVYPHSLRGTFPLELCLGVYLWVTILRLS